MSNEHDFSEAVAEAALAINKNGAATLDDFERGRAALLIVDMINGFAVEGALSSPRVAAISQKIAGLLAACGSKGIPALAFADSHPAESPEFVNYPPHCLSGTPESEVVDEIKAAGGYMLIPKNSTNAFHEAAFQHWLQSHPEIDTFIITGCCTDICVLQLATTLKTWFDSRNTRSQVIVPRALVETYDAPGHSAELMNTMALSMMQMNGIEIPETIR